mgnify:FL=1
MCVVKNTSQTASVSFVRLSGQNLRAAGCNLSKKRRSRFFDYRYFFSKYSFSWGFSRSSARVMAA